LTLSPAKGNYLKIVLNKETPMTQSIHGHEVLHFMLENKDGFPDRESLQAAIVARFGADARFHTCSAEGMDAATLIGFLEKKGKFVPTGAGFNTEPEKICNH
jgi:probable metal-binding protein